MQAGSQQVAAKIEQLAGRDVLSQELNAGLVELMGFIKNRDAHARKQLRHARLAHGEIGKKQMMVDDHHIGRQGFAPGQIDMTGAKTRTGRTQAILARRSDQRNHGRALVQTRQLGEIARAGRLSPHFDAPQHMRQRTLGHQGLAAGLLHAVKAQVAAAPLEQRGTHRHAQGLDQTRQIPAKQLILQGFGGR